MSDKSQSTMEYETFPGALLSLELWSQGSTRGGADPAGGAWCAAAGIILGEEVVVSEWPHFSTLWR